MASTTTNIGLTKPAGTDQALISAINGNMDIIDTKMGAVGNTSVQSQITSLSDQIWTDGTRITTDIQTYLNTLDVGHYNVAFAFNAPGLPEQSSTDCHVFIWDNNHNGVVHAINANKKSFVGYLSLGALTWEEMALNSNKVQQQSSASDTNKGILFNNINGSLEFGSANDNEFFIRFHKSTSYNFRLYFSNDHGYVQRFNSGTAQWETWKTLY